ncbi:hypothetical protein ATY31_11290 [Sinorhizobium americanum]|uniref:Uncharacterized protein n=1 Tax=Sinorhizobium americanum TaxID=194963 RepID=A0A2S3YQ37_9HYPH|nr:hypothetical protein ATY31_11290 [Sinorhizobium americanum]
MGMMVPDKLDFPAIDAGLKRARKIPGENVTHPLFFFYAQYSGMLRQIGLKESFAKAECERFDV